MLMAWSVIIKLYYVYKLNYIITLYQNMLWLNIIVIHALVIQSHSKYHWNMWNAKKKNLVVLGMILLKLIFLDWA